jgi:hypothetical protein
MESFAGKTWSFLKNLVLTNPAPRRGKTPLRPRLELERFEERLVPSSTPIDLTTLGAVGGANGAIFQQGSTQPAGNGVIHAFLRLQADGVEQGYNTDARPVQFDQKTDPNFTRSLSLDSIPQLDIGGVTYREFRLNINQKSSQPLLSLDELRFYVSSAPNLTGYDPSSNQLAGLNAVYDLGTNWVELNARLSHGIGSSDMYVYVPSSLFGAAGVGSYVYLYSKFGVNVASNGGFEQWSIANNLSAQDSGSITGTVVDTSGNPLQGVTLFLDTSGTGVYTPGEVTVTTDINGQFTFTGLATGIGTYSTYTIGQVVPNGYQQVSSTNTGPLTLTTTDFSIGGVLFVDMLIPPSPTGGSGGGTSSSGSLPNT